MPLPIPFRIAMISATNAQRDVIGGITRAPFLIACKWYHVLETLLLGPGYRERGKPICNVPPWSVALANTGSTSKGTSTICK